jgi:hypothetical protein
MEEPSRGTLEAGTMRNSALLSTLLLLLKQGPWSVYAQILFGLSKQGYSFRHLFIKLNHTQGY